MKGAKDEIDKNVGSKWDKWGSTKIQKKGRIDTPGEEQTAPTLLLYNSYKSALIEWDQPILRFVAGWLTDPSD